MHVILAASGSSLTFKITWAMADDVSNFVQFPIWIFMNVWLFEKSPMKLFITLIPGKKKKSETKGLEENIYDGIPQYFTIPLPLYPSI